MSKFIDPEEQRAARERLRVVGNNRALQGIKKLPSTPPLPRAKTFNVNEWKTIVDRMGSLAQVLTMVESGYYSQETALREIDRQLIQLNRELLGGIK